MVGVGIFGQVNCPLADLAGVQRQRCVYAKERLNLLELLSNFVGGRFQ